VAGLTVSLVALPLALGFGVTSGAGAASGIATAVIAGLIAAILGGSEFQVSGPTGAMTVILIPIIAKWGTSALFLLGLMAGVFIIAMGLARLGRFVEKVPWSVVEGFTLGIAFIIALQQVPLVLDVSRGDGENPVTIAVSTVVSAMASPLHVAAIAIVLTTLAIKIVWSLLRRRFIALVWVPASAVAIVTVSLAVFVFGIDTSVIGALPAGDVFNWGTPIPDINFGELILPAISVALLGAVESLMAARVADAMANHDRPAEHARHRSNAELIGQGLATIGSAFAGGMPATGAIARTAVNVHAGARTRFASAIHALVLLVLVFGLAPLVSAIPLAVLAGVLLGTSWRIANPTSIREALQTTWPNRVVYVVTAASVLFIDLIWGLIIGVVLYVILWLISRAASTGGSRPSGAANSSES